MNMTFLDLLAKIFLKSSANCNLFSYFQVWMLIIWSLTTFKSTGPQKWDVEHTGLTVVSILTCPPLVTLKLFWLRRNKLSLKFQKKLNQPRKRFPKRRKRGKNFKWIGAKVPCKFYLLAYCDITKLLLEANKYRIRSKPKYSVQILFRCPWLGNHIWWLFLLGKI